MKDLLKMLLAWILPTLILAGIVNTLVVLTRAEATGLEKLGGVLAGLGELTASLGGWTLLRDKASRDSRAFLRGAILLGIGVMGPGLALMVSQALIGQGRILALLGVSAVTVVPCGVLMAAGALKKRPAGAQKAQGEGPRPDPARMERLKALRDAGLLTKEEYEGKRKEILKER